MLIRLLFKSSSSIPPVAVTSTTSRHFEQQIEKERERTSGKKISQLSASSNVLRCSYATSLLVECTVDMKYEYVSLLGLHLFCEILGVS